MTHFEPCPPPVTHIHSIDAWAVNADCATVTAFPVDSLLEDETARRL
jgi:hypothetical protein